MKYTLPQIKKAVVTVVGFVVTVATVGLAGHLFPEDWTAYIVGVIGVASSYGVFAARNAPVRPDQE